LVLGSRCRKLWAYSGLLGGHAVDRSVSGHPYLGITSSLLVIVVGTKFRGLVRDISNGTYELHPLLTSHLRSKGDPPEPCQRAFVEAMALFADMAGQNLLRT
jgi:hypothetical protein